VLSDPACVGQADAVQFAFQAHQAALSRFSLDPQDRT
jgi:hypothetical protein